MGGSHHPFLGVLGVMSAKNTAVNLMILTTFLSFLLYRRANKRPVVPWAQHRHAWSRARCSSLAAGVVLFYGIYGYFVEAIVRIGFSVYQVRAVLAMHRRRHGHRRAAWRAARESRGEIRWGQMPARSQYALFILAVTFTWLMGLMGFARSGIRQHWHVWEVMRDTSADAATPALGYAANMISICVLIFLGLVAFIFWLGGLAEKRGAQAHRARGATRARRRETDRHVAHEPQGPRWSRSCVARVLHRWSPTSSRRSSPRCRRRSTSARDATPEALVAAGERVYNGAGGCTACHGLGTRAPNLLTDHAGQGAIGARCGTREPGKDCKAYLHESLTQSRRVRGAGLRAHHARHAAAARRAIRSGRWSRILQSPGRRGDRHGGRHPRKAPGGAARRRPRAPARR